MTNNNGFTMIEVFVIAVIVAILSITSVLVYNGYIKHSAQQTVDNLAKTAATSANAYFRKTGSHPDSVKLNLFLTTPGRYTVTINTGVQSVKITDIKYEVSGTANY